MNPDDRYAGFHSYTATAARVAQYAAAGLAAIEQNQHRPLGGKDFDAFAKGIAEPIRHALNTVNPDTVPPTEHDIDAWPAGRLLADLSVDHVIQGRIQKLADALAAAETWAIGVLRRAEAAHGDD